MKLLPNWTFNPEHLTPFLLERQKINALPHAINSACLAVPEIGSTRIHVVLGFVCLFFSPLGQ